ncbi:hypothetical protein M433DRAFT_28284 [Acidomyces richmondensis BFW]|nr:MAG: hypothetical protein FE78DRAFT_41374 [Acidomyces sp. 'richmondensis']KYG40205.1 hypothetical protein M433DRAFT_28284 [Acidomyces richmondensis BFW]
MPSMTITIQLPIATIIEIRRQGNGLDEVLRTLCLSPSSTSRLVHDIVRNVTRVANALPTTVLSTNNTIKAIAVAGMTKFATMVCSPEDDVFAQRASIPAKPPTTPISFIIEEPSGKLESFRMLSRTTLREVANMYQERTGIQVTGVTFDCTSGSVTYGSGLDSKTLYQLDVRQGDKILAHGGLHSKINVYFRDLALNEIRVDCTKAFSVRELLICYADRTWNDVSEFTFTFNRILLSTQDSGIIDDRGIDNGAVISVSLLSEGNNSNINVYIMDTMGRKDCVTVTRDTSVEEFLYIYSEDNGFQAENLVLTFGGLNISSGLRKLDSIHKYGITDGSIVYASLSPFIPPPIISPRLPTYAIPFRPVLSSKDKSSGEWGRNNEIP